MTGSDVLSAMAPRWPAMPAWFGRAYAGVVASTPFAQGVVMVEHESRPAFPIIQGVDVEKVGGVIPLDRYLSFGSLADLDDDSIILSSRLAVAIGARVGSKVQVYSPLQLEKSQNDEILLPRELTVVGLFHIGHQQLDSSTVIVTLRLMEELYGLGRAVHGINLKIAPGLDADDAAARINAVLRAGQGTLWKPVAGLEARSWREMNQDFLWVIQLEKNMMLFIILFVVVVAAFLTMSLLLVLVVKKTREIGLLGALGASRREVALCFCFQGVTTGVAGTAGGLALGFTLLYFRNGIIRSLTQLTGGQQLLERFYQFSELPAHTEPRDLAVIVVLAILLSTAAGIIPALLAARLKPVEALRYE